MLLAGLWYSNEKPDMQVYLMPIVEELSMLETLGILFNIIIQCCSYNKRTLGVEVCPPEYQKPFQVTLHVLCCSCDLPARAIVQNFNQFNGAYGCGFCEQPGSSFRTDNGGTVHVFPYDHKSPKGPPRTEKSCIEHAKEAIRDHVVVMSKYMWGP